jgi:ABC-type Fe3+/spermidine/putrescine transport system ATPase subunit
MEKGRIIQIGTPMEIYENPINTFVANFIGQTNIIRGEVVSTENETIELRLSNNVSISLSEDFLKYRGKRVTCSLRPDRIHISRDHFESHNYEFPAKVLSKVYMGPLSSYIVSVMDEINVNVIQQSNKKGDIIDEGQELYVTLDPQNLVFIDDK